MQQLMPLIVESAEELLPPEPRLQRQREIYDLGVLAIGPDGSERIYCTVGELLMAIHGPAFELEDLPTRRDLRVAA